MQTSMGGAEIDNLFRALGDPTRRVIIERLAECPASVSELTEPFDMSLPAIYQHLRILREAGLVQTVKSGRIRTCSLDVRVLRRAEQWLTQRRAMWERRLDALADHLAREGTKSEAR